MQKNQLPKITKRKKLFFPKLVKKPTARKNKPKLRRQVKNSFFRWWKLALLLLVLVIVGIGGYILLFHTLFFKVLQIDVLGARDFVSAADVKAVTWDFVGDTSIFGVNTVDLQAILIGSFKGAKNITLSRKLPHTLVITVTERIPLGLVYNDASVDYFLLDADGYVLGIVDRQITNLPEIRYEGDIKIGQFINKDLVPMYLEIVDVLDKESVKISSMSFYPKHTQLYLETGTEILISDDRNKDTAIVFARDLIRQLAAEEKNPKKIDLRYDKVIVSY